MGRSTSPRNRGYWSWYLEFEAVLLLSLCLLSWKSWRGILLWLLPNQMRCHLHWYLHFRSINCYVSMHLLPILEWISSMVVYLRLTHRLGTTGCWRYDVRLFLRKGQEINQSKIAIMCNPFAYISFPLVRMDYCFLPCLLQERHRLHGNRTSQRWIQL